MRISDWSSDVFSSDLNSMLTRRVVAERAEEKTGQWLLRNAMETGLRDGVAISETPQDMVWKIKLSPQNLLRLTAPNARLSVSAARDALNGSEASSRTPSFRSEEHTSELQSLMR